MYGSLDGLITWWHCLVLVEGRRRGLAGENKATSVCPWGALPAHHPYLHASCLSAFWWATKCTALLHSSLLTPRCVCPSECVWETVHKDPLKPEPKWMLEQLTCQVFEWWKVRRRMGIMEGLWGLAPWIPMSLPIYQVATKVSWHTQMGLQGSTKLFWSWIREDDTVTMGKQAPRHLGVTELLMAQKRVIGDWRSLLKGCGEKWKEWKVPVCDTEALKSKAVLIALSF